jgi:drug/metabolite transporter (DMT)-like permease
VQTGIVLGLAAALCWGVADFCARWATRAAGTFRTLLAVQVVGLAGLLAARLPLKLVRLTDAPPGLVIAAVGINLVILAGAGLLYRGLAMGTLALVSPIAATFAAVTALLALATGERVSPVELVGIALTLVGVIVASAVSDPAKGGHAEFATPNTQIARRRRFAPGLLEALGAMLLFGAGYWLLRFVTPALGGVTVALIGRLADLLVLGALALALLLAQTVRSPVAVPPGGSHDPATGALPPRGGASRAFWLFVVPVGLLDTAANVAYNLGITVAPTSIVVVLASLFSAVTVLLAWVFLHERLVGWQWAGVAAILIGILLVNG